MWFLRGYIGVALLVAMTQGCGDNDAYEADGPARAYRATAWNQLIGGPDAYGMPGDYVLENGKIKIVIQDVGESFGPGLYGGSILDADRVRKGRETCCGHGLDQFVEVFPTVNTMVPRVYDGGEPPIKIFVKNDGSDGGPAVITVQGESAPLLTILGLAVQGLGALRPNTVFTSFTTDYILEPGKEYVEIRTAVDLKDAKGAPVSAEVMDEVTSYNMFDELIHGNLVFGNALFFGIDVSVFGPRFGYYLDGYIWRLVTELNESTISNPISSEFVAASGDRVSYGMTAREGALKIPLFSASLSILFSARYPNQWSNQSSRVDFTNYFIVGEGDIASVVDAVHDIRGDVTGTLEGNVIDAYSYMGLSGIKVFVFEDPRYYDDNDPERLSSVTLPDLLERVTNPKRRSPLVNVIETDKGEDLVPDGNFHAKLEPGHYLLLAHHPAHPEGELVPVEISAGQTTRQALGLIPSGRVYYEVRNEAGDLIPAKISFRGMPIDPEADTCKKNDMDPACRRYGDLEAILGDGFLADRLAKVEHTHNGYGTVQLRPGVYEYFVSRGPEYSLDHGVVRVDPHYEAQIYATVRHVVDSRGFMSLDIHQHCQNSQDAAVPPRERLVTDVAEDVEILNGTDHDYITNYRPLVWDLGINRYIHTILSDELTTFEIGHFIGFPLKFEPLKDGNGAPAWIGHTPQQIFDSLRNQAGLDPRETVVHIAHPRDSLFGYFYMYGLDPAGKADQGPGTFKTSSSILSIGNTDLVNPMNFSQDFESLELLNAKRLELIRTPTNKEYETICEMTDGSEETCAAHGKTTIYDIMERTLWEQDKVLRDPSYSLEGGYKQILDDWFAYLLQGVNFTATAGSDSHTKVSNEAGCCRTYVKFSSDEPMAATDKEVAERIRSHQATVSYGPFIDMSINGRAHIGDTITNQDPEGKVTLHVRVETAGWYDVDRIEIYGNGLLIGEIDSCGRTGTCLKPTGERRFTPWGPGERPPYPEARCYTRGKTIGHATIKAFDDDITCFLDRDDRQRPIDTWFVTIAMGKDKMFPVFTSNEYPYIQVGSLISIALQGFIPAAGDLLGKNPSSVFAIHPYAMTNPIWVDADGNGSYDTPPRYRNCGTETPCSPLPYEKPRSRQQEIMEALQEVHSSNRDIARVFLNRSFLPRPGPRPSGTYTSE